MLINSNLCIIYHWTLWCTVHNAHVYMSVELVLVSFRCISFSPAPLSFNIFVPMFFFHSSPPTQKRPPARWISNCSVNKLVLSFVLLLFFFFSVYSCFRTHRIFISYYCASFQGENDGKIRTHFYYIAMAENYYKLIRWVVRYIWFNKRHSLYRFYQGGWTNSRQHTTSQNILYKDK